MYEMKVDMCAMASSDEAPKHCINCSTMLWRSLRAVGTCLDEHALLISYGDAEKISDVDWLERVVVSPSLLPLLDAAAELLLSPLVVRWMTGEGVNAVLRNGSTNVPLAKLCRIC